VEDELFSVASVSEEIAGFPNWDVFRRAEDALDTFSHLDFLAFVGRAILAELE
jgi:hypothetical protein